MKGFDMIAEMLVANGFKVGAKVRFGYFKGSEVKEYAGTIIRVRMAADVKEKNPVKEVSLFLVIVETAEGIKSFWEANMTGIEIL